MGNLGQEDELQPGFLLYSGGILIIQLVLKP